jgi:hypothetical protein
MEREILKAPHAQDAPILVVGSWEVIVEGGTDAA